ncbi:TRAP transporter permease [Aeromicrobium ponti]|uniref:TRAP transporter 4TM/12TM fusion protein n=1 Tax=Cytobacillus oceanisediminis TaxID=665099 RepID=A0A562JSG7_9BACI|nr:TRAP transporter permease [Cytobacillus oceanisediminis]TWH85864.1 TRAP transporter 4TM/12TM fusion protein [Cytobacillus oceanisediminis]
MSQLANQFQNEEEILKKYDSDFRTRDYLGLTAKVVTGILIIWALFQLYTSSFGILEAIKMRAWHLGFLLILSFLIYPATKKSAASRTLPTIWDMICILLTLISIGYLLLTYDTFARERFGIHVEMDYYMAAIGILVVFEASRRVIGNALTIICAIFLIYNFVGAYIPGALGHVGFSFERVTDIMFWGSQGLFGIALGVSATYIFLFVLFGAFLKNSGFTDFINDIALSIAGWTAGGPAKVSVIGSGFMGMVNGSAVANVVTTGAVTIPLMKKTGYKSKFAGAVEAVASTGGQFAPPIMGAAGFIMAEFLGVPYRTIMLAAIIPAFLYYVTVFMVVHFEAKRIGLTGISKENIPNMVIVMKDRGHLLLPLIILIGLLSTGVTPLYAAVFALISTVLASWLRKSTRMNFKMIVDSLIEGSKGAIGVGIACAIVGVVVGTISLTSLGLTLGNNILALAGDNLIIAAILTMLISIVLGMGIPATAAYIIVATIAAPLLVKLGVPPLAAHMFAFFYSALSNITPPVALASYAAAGLAGAPPNKVGIEAMRIGITGFIIPFFFLFNPVLLFNGETVTESLIAMATSTIGVVCLAGGLQGWFLTRTNLIQRLALFVTAFLMIKPTLLTDIIGLSILAAIIIWQKIASVTINDQKTNDVSETTSNISG